MTDIAIDYSFARPAPSAIRAAGVGGVIRYASRGRNSKNLTAPEAAALRAAGLWIAIVFESYETRVNDGGYAGGVVDAIAAKTFCDELGYPAGCPIFFACDTAPNGPAAASYFSGVRSVKTTRPVGWYGGMQVGLDLKAAGLVSYVWVANAASWSGYRSFSDLAPVARANPQVAMLQSVVRTLPGLPASAYDLDEIIHPFPAWGRSITPPAPKPVPKPIPPTQAPTIDHGDDDVKTTDIKGIHLDTHGEGEIAVKGVHESQIVATVVIGGSDANKVKRYDKVPATRVVAGSNPALIVIENGEPSGVYTVRVSHA